MIISIGIVYDREISAAPILELSIVDQSNFLDGSSAPNDLEVGEVLAVFQEMDISDLVDFRDQLTELINKYQDKSDTVVDAGFTVEVFDLEDSELVYEEDDFSE